MGREGEKGQDRRKEQLSGEGEGRKGSGEGSEVEWGGKERKGKIEGRSS